MYCDKSTLQPLMARRWMTTGHLPLRQPNLYITRHFIWMHLIVNIPWHARKGGTWGVSCEFIFDQCMSFVIVDGCNIYEIGCLILAFSYISIEFETHRADFEGNMLQLTRNSIKATGVSVPTWGRGICGHNDFPYFPYIYGPRMTRVGFVIRWLCSWA